MQTTRKKFYGEWLRRSIAGPYAIFEVVSAVIACGGATAYCSPEMNATISILIWIVPVCVFATTALIAIAMSPYSILHDAEVAAEARETILRELHTEAASRIANLETSRTTRFPAVREQLLTIIEDGQQLARDRGIKRNDVTKFQTRVMDFLRTELRDSHARRIQPKCCVVHHEEHAGYLSKNVTDVLDDLNVLTTKITEHDLREGLSKP